jgi:hypothetical protein
MCNDGDYNVRFSYSFISRNLEMEGEKVYARVNSVNLLGEYGFSDDINVYGTVGMSSFGDENIEPEFGFRYGVGLQAILYKFKDYSKRSNKKKLSIRADLQYFTFTSSGGSTVTDLSIENKWQEGQLTIAIFRETDTWNLYGGMCLDLTRGNIQIEDSDQVDFTEHLMFGIRAGLGVHVSDNFDIFMETGLIDEASFGIGGNYNIIRKRKIQY